MPDAFFQKKRKRTSGGGSGAGASSSSAGRGRARGSNIRTSGSRNGKAPRAGPSRMRGKQVDSDEEGTDDDDAAEPGTGIEDMDLQHRYDGALNSEEEAELAETPAEARVRLAKMYLEGLKGDALEARGVGYGGEDEDGADGDDFFESDAAIGFADAAQADRENIAARLQKDLAEQSGNISMFIADRLATPDSYDYSNTMLAVRGHRLSVTSAIVSNDAKSLFTASKDGHIIRWRLRDGKLLRVLPKRAKVLDDQGRPLPPPKNARSKTSGAARRRERMSKGKSRAGADPGSLSSASAVAAASTSSATAAATNGIVPHASASSNASTYLPVGEDEGHTDEVWTLSISSDGQYLASGGKDKRICIWSLRATDEATGAVTPEERFVKALGGHKDSISALCFRSGSQELYTASLDRTLKLFDVKQLSYIETLFGHQEAILSLSALRAETAVTAGGRDRTCRYWKIREESQLVFRAGIKSKLREVMEGGELARIATGSSTSGQKPSTLNSPIEAMEGSVECVSMIDAHHFISGGDSGTISLWHLNKKKPLFSVPVAHGHQVTKSETEGEIKTPRWITALASLPYSDVFASGSWDGRVRLWALVPGGPSGSMRSFRPLFHLDVPGVINSLQMVLPPLSSVVIAESEHKDTDKEDETSSSPSGLVSTTAVDPKEWKRTRGLLQSLDSDHDDDDSNSDDDNTSTASSSAPTPQRYTKLTSIRGTKSNIPPLLIAGVGQEPKFGRWIKVATKNGAVVVPLHLKSHE
ncbi:WD40 repeat-like protein [Testicularia cyperi]|uniref:WD40 repeat-like protein n=1 Tax=Testicularia cyperi TaxID=1882483 RepID=A0A317XMU4_9BASI|nr:WD40 repeat-like protein [Testicularia cyperi]